MLFKRHFLKRIEQGTVRLAFRRWRRPTVKNGGTLLTAVGRLAIDDVAIVSPETIGETEAKLAGFADADTLRRELNRRSDGDVYRIAFHLEGPDPRVALRERSDLGHDELTAVEARLDRLDRASTSGPWTRATLSAIRDRPGVRAPDLAASFGLDTQPFKRNVRKLKALGLTESLKVGYRLSPRGASVLDALTGSR